MFALYQFAPRVISAIGEERFVEVYLVGGLVSALTSRFGAILHLGRSNMKGSLGASGSVAAIVAFHIVMSPAAPTTLIILPMFTFSAASLLASIACVEFGMVASGMQRLGVDHAAHLGGYLVGIESARQNGVSLSYAEQVIRRGLSDTKLRVQEFLRSIS